jgi:hypothetical protein
VIVGPYLHDWAAPIQRCDLANNFVTRCRRDHVDMGGMAFGVEQADAILRHVVTSYRTPRFVAFLRAAVNRRIAWPERAEVVLPRSLMTIHTALQALAPELPLPTRHRTYQPNPHFMRGRVAAARRAGDLARGWGASADPGHCCPGTGPERLPHANATHLQDDARAVTARPDAAAEGSGTGDSAGAGSAGLAITSTRANFATG